MEMNLQIKSFNDTQLMALGGLSLIERIEPDLYIPDDYMIVGPFIKKKIKELNLSIVFSDLALMALDIISGGKVMLALFLLKDVLNKSNEAKITLNTLSQLYVDGFYNEFEVLELIDNNDEIQEFCTL